MIMWNKTITVILTWVLVCGIFSSITSACDNGWFGSSCQYKCHCTNNNCDEDGSCTSGSKCVDGWFGPACQYANLATKETSSEASLTDNNDRTCIDDVNIQEVTISFPNSTLFTWMRIQFKDPDQGPVFQLQFKTHGQDSTIDCQNQMKAAVTNTSMDIHCDLDVVVDEVILKGEEVQSLCSIYISGGRNVALKQATRQSSNFANKNQYPSKYAVDGDISSFTHTNGVTDPNPTWNLTFQQTKLVNRYVIYNRPREILYERLMGFILQSFTENRSIVFNYTDEKTPPQLLYHVISPGEKQPISYVTIQARFKYKAKQIILSLGEVEIFGESACPRGKYGLECGQTCNCHKESETCFVSTGGCPSGCASGFYGKDCKIACSNETYGSDCKYNCSSFCNMNETSERSVCHRETGQCLYGCNSNYSYIDDGKNMCILKPEEQKADGDDGSAAVVAGVVVTCVIVLAVVAVVGFIVWRRRRNLKSTGEPDDRILEIGRPTNLLVGSSEGEESKTKAVKSKGRAHYNMAEGQEHTAIAVEDLDDFMMSHDRQFFEDQFYKIPANSDVAMTVGLSAENNHKNRYKNVCAFDHSRVHLVVNQAKKQGDYINASYVEGYKEQEKFIASQGPNKIMIDDFIRMLWEQKTEKVVMLTNLVEEGKQKCERYWPEKDDIKFGEIKVKLITTDVFAEYTIRRLQLSKVGEPVQELTHFHFTSWPDKDTPNTPWGLVDFQQRVAVEPTARPIVVHCSAGVGRTGTFIALRNGIIEAEATGSVNFFFTLYKLRQERMMMIQTLNQYIFLHKAAQVAIVCMGTTLTVHNMTEKLKALETKCEKDGTKLNKEFKAICKLCREIKEEEKEANTEEEANVYQNNPPNHLKNRFQDIVPEARNRPFLTSDNRGMDSYINAVFAPSLNKKDQNLLTQLPLPTTISDFWRMVTQYNVSLIVAFELDLKDKDSTIVDYLPPTEGEPVRCPPFDIQTGPITLGDFWEKQKLCVKHHSQKKHRLSLSHSVSIVSNMWNPTMQDHTKELTSLKCTTTDIGPKSMLALMKEIRSNSTKHDSRTVFVCRNGAEYSGLACILSLLLDRMDHDQRLIVPLVVGTIKTIRPQVISSLDQYKFLYQVLQRYSQNRSSHSDVGKSSLMSKSAKGTLSSDLKAQNDVSEQDPDHIYCNIVEENVEK